METVVVPSREIPVIADADFVVVGGGCAGVAAAIAAAQSGIRAVLIEKSNCAGGMVTNGLLPSIIYLSDGANLLSGGLCYELVKRIDKMMNAEVDLHWTLIHPEVVKLVLDGMLEESGVQVFYQMHCSEAIVEDGSLTGVVVSTPAGIGVIRGKIFADATGDGNLSALAGVPCEVGDENGEVMAPTLCTMFNNIDYDQVDPYERKTVMGRKEWGIATKEGRAPLEEGHFVGFFPAGKSVGIGNLGHEYGCRPLDAVSYTEACIAGRKRAQIYLDFFKREVPGFANAELAATASMLGVRESRRVCGDYRMTGDDYVCRRHFDDEIGCFSYPIDIHASNSNVEKQAQVEKELNRSHYQKGENYGIPYRALLASGIRNLLLTGRCISTDRQMQSSIRVVPGCMITGEAAGIAAAEAVKNMVSLRAVDISSVQKILKSRGIYFPEKRA